MFELVKFIHDKEKQLEFIAECMPFIVGMYTEKEQAMFGDGFLNYPYWLSVWHRGGGYFLVRRNEAGKIMSLGVLTHYSEMWYNTNRLEVNRYAIHKDIEDQKAEVAAMFKYLIENKELIGYDLLYYVVRDDYGNEHKILRYPEIKHGDSE